jgi:hypothetical protein
MGVEMKCVADNVWCYSRMSGVEVVGGVQVVGVVSEPGFTWNQQRGTTKTQTVYDLRPASVSSHLTPAICM